MNRYILIGLSVLALISLFAFFSDESNADYNYSGIVHDVKQSSNGFLFYLDTGSEDLRCYCSEQPMDLGYYAVRGSFSQDNKIFFAEVIRSLE